VSVNVICLFVIDPGESTGLAWGRFRESGSVSDRIESRREFGTTTVTGHDLRQARLIFRLWTDFQSAAYHDGLPYELVIEDFILTRLRSSDRAGLSPVRITSILDGYRHGMADAYEAAGFGPSRVADPIFQQPSDAFSYATDARLRRWGIWLPGASKEHEREALAHLCLRLSRRTQIVHRES
jgi:hypothetical protein